MMIIHTEYWVIEHSRKSSNLLALKEWAPALFACLVETAHLCFTELSDLAVESERSKHGHRVSAIGFGPCRIMNQCRMSLTGDSTLPELQQQNLDMPCKPDCSEHQANKVCFLSRWGLNVQSVGGWANKDQTWPDSAKSFKAVSLRMLEEPGP